MCLCESLYARVSEYIFASHDLWSAQRASGVLSNVNREESRGHEGRRIGEVVEFLKARDVMVHY